jgi:hypothetical protein
MSAPSTRQVALSCELLENRLVPDATSFVTSLYTNVLYRAPDAPGLALYVQELQNGATNQQIAQQFWDSPEHRGVEVDAYYRLFLHRFADDGGRTFWVNELVSGAMNEVQVETKFLSSPEYMNMLSHSTSLLYINGLYLDVLGRLANADDLTYWENVQQTFGAEAVATGIVTSAEAYTDVLSADYVRFLNRTPDQSGLNYFLGQLESGKGTVESVAEAILGSAEYAAGH